MAQKKWTTLDGVAVRFSLVPLSSLKEDYSCSVLVFGMQLADHNREAMFDTPIGKLLSRDKGDYDILIINAQMALIFVDDQKKGICCTDRMCSQASLACRTYGQ